jgi:hypothetical protein
MRGRFRLWRKIMNNAALRLVDQAMTVRVLAKVLATLAAIAVSGWWFMFDEVRLVQGDIAKQGSELAREIDGSARFQLEQRDRLWNCVDALWAEIHVVQLELGMCARGCSRWARRRMPSLPWSTPPGGSPRSMIDRPIGMARRRRSERMQTSGGFAWA